MSILGFADICDWEAAIVLGDRTNEIEFWQAFAGKYGDKLLELGAGTGCFTIPLLQMGYHISALDISAEALSYLKLKADKLQYGGELKIIQRDMRNFDIDDKLTACFASYSTFQYLLCQSDQLHCLQAVHRHLLADGILCLDLDNEITKHPDSLPFTELYNEFNHEYQAQISLYTSWDTSENDSQRNWHDYYQVEYKDGRKMDFTNEISLKAIKLNEIRLLLKEAGFCIMKTYGDYDYCEYAVETPRMIIIAQKIYCLTHFMQ
jgi:SAM-dependent methyltransferase